MKQTAIQWLLSELPHLDTELLKPIIEQAKAMEKKQIVDAVDCFASEWELYDGEQYYNETFKSE